MNMEKEPRSKKLIETIVHMANNFGMATVAEGIENHEQEKIIESLGCTYGQGFYFCKPISIEELCKFQYKCSNNDKIILN
jgi:EAL domain-containing protein (putative c-di-GMP-specific phosphodiesterase class I)